MDLLDSLEEPNQTDSLSSLEERIVQAVQLVTRLRQERDVLAKENEAIAAERDGFRKDLEAALADRQIVLGRAADAEAELDRVTSELTSLRSERKQVRVRIEKLLGQIDQLSTA